VRGIWERHLLETSGRDIWERHLGEASERDIWERHLGETSRRDTWETSGVGAAGLGWPGGLAGLRQVRFNFDCENIGFLTKVPLKC